ncbi:hypothetical protein MYFR107205_18630 [Mycolicibacterium frederiksbergense]
MDASPVREARPRVRFGGGFTPGEPGVKYDVRGFTPGVGGNPAVMTSNKLKLLFAGAGVGAVLAMTGLTAVQTTTFSADPALPEPTVPGVVTEVTEAPTEGPTLEAETPTYTTTTTEAPAP